MCGRIAEHENITDLPTDEKTVSDKGPTDVFNRAVSVFTKLNVLCNENGRNDISPNEVYAQMVCAVEDVKSILRQFDSACRYKINAPPSEDGLTPADVFDMCLTIRKLINAKRVAKEMPKIPVPDAPARDSIYPRDVFFQTQIIIAELNLLKDKYKTISSTPLPIQVEGKVPSDVHRQASLANYLLDQLEVEPSKKPSDPENN